MQCLRRSGPALPRRRAIDRAAAPATSTASARRRGAARLCPPRAEGKRSGGGGGGGVPDEDLRRRIAREDELRDPANFVEYFLPRPIRLAFFGFSSASCVIATLLAAARLAAALSAPDPLLSPLADAGDAAADAAPWAAAAANVAVNAAGAAGFAALFAWDRARAGARVERRRAVRAAQIRAGDREVYTDDEGRRMSRLKEVDEEWILRRLERWGRREGMPFAGPDKAAALRAAVARAAPAAVVEVGAMAGYSAISIGQALPEGARLISLEKEASWWLAAKRFVWQASEGSGAKEGRGAALCDKVDIWLGDGADTRKWAEAAARLGRPIDFVFLDGVPKETLAYLEAAAPHLAEGAVVVADNAGVFKDGGMRPYLERVRGGGDFASAPAPCRLEWRDDVEDAMEVSIFRGGARAASEAAALAAAAAEAAAAAAAGRGADGGGGAGAGAAAAAAAGAGAAGAGEV
ncbi:hypothetical protein Rsub_05992 [Raphidocelis subcapitata]|uniref:catechol O-methyltransferase n=1 Tax=Raphidocelis subcapitata TaxID=307507 RepID=A0A2V0P5X5_9CHLO|nr:hypothetical protein Rsub_05992 [Raphidocelis subcapitata]|eukprot:GBF93260.1 hypothetical protein Rsub_05992 [Raphidocelis subcapitata]